MAKKNSSNGNRVHIEGNVPGQVAVGNSIQQTQSIGHSRPQVSSADLELLRDQFEQLKAQINQAVPPEQQEKALEKVTEGRRSTEYLQGEITSMTESPL